MIDSRSPLDDQLWLAVNDLGLTSEATANLVRAVLPVLADELRRFADGLDGTTGRIRYDLPPDGARSWLDYADMGRVMQGEDDARDLRHRADELDVLALDQPSVPGAQLPQRPEPGKE